MREQATAYGYYIVSDVVREGPVKRLQPVYDIIRRDELPHCRSAAHYHTFAHPDSAARTVILYQAHCRTLLQKRAGHNI
jgi:hypothetical protein